jgi:hypothetical protein
MTLQRDGDRGSRNLAAFKIRARFKSDYKINILFRGYPYFLNLNLTQCIGTVLIIKANEIQLFRRERFEIYTFTGVFKLRCVAKCLLNLRVLIFLFTISLAYGKQPQYIEIS